MELGHPEVLMKVFYSYQIPIVLVVAKDKAHAVKMIAKQWKKLYGTEFQGDGKDSVRELKTGRAAFHLLYED